MSPEKSVLVTGNKTLTAADSGIVQRVRGDAVITLPSTALGLQFVIQNDGPGITNGPAGAVGGNNQSQVTVTPQAADGVTGNGYTATVNKSLVNTKATARVGDRIALFGSGTAGVTAYVVKQVRGVWDRQA